jgi:hypothetical protein
MYVVLSSSYSQQKTYCNPDQYRLWLYTLFQYFRNGGAIGATADPVIVIIKMIITYSAQINGVIGGVSDMLNWNFVSKNF